MRPLRVLVFSATYGAGHVKAAEALIAAIRMIDSSVEIIHKDAIAIINRGLNQILRHSYIGVIKHAPKIWGKYYYRTQEIADDSLLQRFLNTFGRRQLINYIRDLEPDVIVCTYPTVAGVLAQLRVKGELSIPVVTVVTDYTVHSHWIHFGVDCYIVGSPQVARGFVQRGIKASRIQISGIPVNPLFEREADKDERLSKLGLEKDRLTFLVMGGAYGVLGKAKWMCDLVANFGGPVQAIIVCGKDHKLYNSLDFVLQKASNPVVRFEFVNNVDELMSIADIIITKAGGLTVSESLTKRLPIIVFNPIPGQEENNAQYIEEIGAGRVARTDQEFISILDELITNPQEIRKMSNAAAQTLPGHSAEKAVKAILKLARDSAYQSKDEEQVC
ncbi:UDP-N-acetylglucosamine:LPS N-acetylglucosamine transferase [Desulfosporosinus orientis DSM 765]|uniref:UDP-N-acetylglucosamine:LPS N-acetylglucosamine transferase n=1 Tax=Desulfosporosinus orientis (strain ATCC 19365 / DSM 765 / NCIMB 8382 / VKM B-1628 / Singapore I) TaxID=768706 RepID=G7WFK7_DESOD|nr:UDP-N-acetylglucosamine--LPS N-acetylglucosamine transferase [Desulfosporosinus orientis]AET68450.1 UDP-N-acetylglucosamine:LPS N-acetylglucosamine transferase [Desulfosporosinus orientis DSM 765]